MATKRLVKRLNATEYEDDNGDLVLSPARDPSPLMRRMVKETIREAVDSLKSEMDTRFEAMDKAADLLHADFTRVPTDVDRQVGHLKELMLTTISATKQVSTEIFTRVEIQLGDFSKHVDSQWRDRQDVMAQMIRTAVAELRGSLNALIAETQEKFNGVAAQFAERDTRTDQRAGDTKLAVDAAFAAAKEATAKIETGFTKQIDGMVDQIDTKTGNLAGQISDLKDRVQAVESMKAGAGSAWGALLSGAAILMSFATLMVLMFNIRTGHVP